MSVIERKYVRLPGNAVRVLADVPVEESLDLVESFPEMEPSVAMDDVRLERIRQDQRWGEQNHHPVWWMAILVEKFGEAAKALNEDRIFDLRTELVQFSAVAVAAIESLDRDELRRARSGLESGLHGRNGGD